MRAFLRDAHRAVQSTPEPETEGPSADSNFPVNPCRCEIASDSKLADAELTSLVVADGNHVGN